MARDEHLPIYKSALDLTVHMEKVVAMGTAVLHPSYGALGFEIHGRRMG